MTILILLASLTMAPLVQVAGEGESSAELLIERIQKTLEEVDEALLDAADAAAVTNEVDRAVLAHRRAIRDLDELIKQIKYQQSNSSSSGGGGGSQSQSMQGDSQSRESDGSRAPDPSESQNPSGGQDQQGQEEQQQPEGGTPESGQDSQGQGEQRGANAPPPQDETGDFTRENTDGRWGLLPPKLQERLMNLHVDDVPERYRSRLEAYIRALHKEESRASGPNR